MKPLLSALAAICLGASVGGVAHAAPPHRPVPSAEVPFAHFRGIENWRAAKDGSFLVQSNTGHYYRATFFGPCPGMPLASKVDGAHCWLRTLSEISKSEFNAAG